MLIELHFTANSGVIFRPEIDIYYNGELKISKLVLDNCGSVDDPVAKTKNAVLEINPNVTNNHCIKIQSLNISNEYKTNFDFGFQVRHVVADGVELGTYGVNYTCVNPADDSYIEYFVEPLGRLNEIEIINGCAMHVTKGYWANYVNLTGGWIEFEFQTPIYHWLLKQKFGQQLESATTLG